MTSRHSDRWIVVAALVAPVVVAAALIPWRDDLVSTNIALLLVVVVVAVAATGHRAAAALAALVAAGAFNFFHTQPYYSLRINSSDDVETAVLLLVVGLAVAELAVRGQTGTGGWPNGVAATSRALQGLGALVAQGEDADYVLLAAEAELTQLLQLAGLPLRGHPTWTTRSSR